MAKFSMLVLAVFTIGFSYAQEDPLPDSTEAGYHVCQVSNASPKISDCKEAMDYIENQCYPGNFIGSGCRTLTTVGTCAITFCQDDASSQAGIDGPHLSFALNNLLKHCTKDGKVGGYYHYRRGPPRCYSGYDDYINVEFH